MSVADVPTRYTADDLLAMPDAKSYELIDGELVERNSGGVSSWVAGQVISRVNSYVNKCEAGWVFGPDAGFQCSGEDHNRVRRPDGSFIRRGRFPDEELPCGHIPIPPDLAIEVISPNDLYLDVQAKVAEYLAAGVRLIWVIDPDNRSVVVHSSESDQPVFLRENDTLTGGDVLPGFECRVADLFRSSIAKQSNE
jgi:Uma2 family endonuclease